MGNSTLPAGSVGASGGVGLIGIRAEEWTNHCLHWSAPSSWKFTDAEVGDTIILGLSTYALPLEISAEVKFFPTLDPDDKPFAVVDLSRFNQAATRYNPRPHRGPNELWLAGDDSSAVHSGIDAEPVSAALREQGISVRKVFHAPTHGGVAGRAAAGERWMGRPAGPAVPCRRIGQRFRPAAVLSPGLQGAADRVRPTPNLGNLPRPDAAYLVGEPVPDGHLWRRAGNTARLAHRRQRASPDGSGRGRRASHSIAGADYRLATACWYPTLSLPL